MGTGYDPAADLRALLDETLRLAREVADDEASWTKPVAVSQAGEELRAQEDRTDRPAGSWPWLAALKIARWGLQVALEIADGFASELQRAGTSYAADILCRGVLEHASLAFWLLDPDIDDQERLARVLVYRLHTATETERAVRNLGLADDKTASGYGETSAEVLAEIANIGWTGTGKTAAVTYDGRTVRWPGYTDRVAQLVRRIWPQQEKWPYAVLSAVAHAELFGLFRNLAALAGEGDPRPDPSGAAIWLWHDAYLAIGSLVFAAERTAGFLGRPRQVTALRSWTAVLDRSLPELRPAP